VHAQRHGEIVDPDTVHETEKVVTLHPMLLIENGQRRSRILLRSRSTRNAD
jgi:hypothetical protein